MEIQFSIFILLIIFVNSDDYCQKIQCADNLVNDKCVQVEYETSYFQQCSDGKICNIEFDDPVQDSKCIEKTKFKRLPSLPCETDDDCLSNKCIGKMCLGSFKGEECNSVIDCVYGYTCRKDSENVYRCLDPITTGNKCIYDTDCVRESGCLNGICTKYYSLENNQQSSYQIYEELSFCKSGYTDELGICQNITLINETSKCSQENRCQYNSSNGEIFTIDSNCLCGYNREGNKYCLLGSGNANYTKYINKLKNYYLYNKNCHLSERNAEPCQKDLLSNDSFVLNKIHELINAKYWAKSNNKLIGAPECAFKVELPDYDRDLDKDYNPEPQPGEGSCPIFKCENYKIPEEFCAKIDFKNIYNINISLYDICDDQVCKLGDLNDIYYNENKNSKCYSNELNKRYPGEKCDLDSECIYPLNNPSSQFHKCEDGRCNGMDEDGICEDNTWCLAGYYCDKYSGKCKEQKEEDDSCLDSKECQNDLICLNNKCSDDLYSLKDGHQVPENEDKEIQKRFCKSGEVYDSICVSYNDIDNKTNDNVYKKCNYGDKCIYNIKGLNYEKQLEISCPCGYNAEGQGYCPHFHDYSKDDWDDYKDVLITNYNNECHTENRYDCYKKDKEEKEKKLKNKVEKGHLFYKAVPCAKNVLDGKYLYIKKIALSVGIIFILN